VALRLDGLDAGTLCAAIDKWVLHERNRRILKRRLVDGICYEPLAEEFGLSARHVKTIVYNNETIIFKHIHEI
jgi:hypothetical protein